MGQNAKKEIGSPSHTRQEDVEVKCISIKPYAHNDQRKKIEGKMITGVKARPALTALMDRKPGERDQSDNCHIHIAAPSGYRDLCWTGDQKDNRRNDKQEDERCDVNLT